MSHTVTIFQNIRETDHPYHLPVEATLDRIREGKKHRERIQEIRKEKDKARRNELKKELPAICFSGTFTKRTDSGLIDHSGLICLDFDDYKTTKDMNAEKERLSKDKYTYSVFVSPSGNGLKALVRVLPNADHHVNFFNALEKHYSSDHFDKNCKNISRVCYESYDPFIYVNENSEVWAKMEDDEYREVKVKIDSPTIPITDDNKVVEVLCKWWMKKWGMVDGERNANLYKLARAFNDYGINRTLASQVLREFEQEDFSVKEIENTISSAYKNEHEHGTKYLEDSERVSNVKAQMKRGVSKKEIRSQLQESNLESEVVDAVIEKIEKENETPTFWTKTDKGVIKISPLDFKTFLEDNGFHKYSPEGSKNYIFVRVTNNLIDHTSEKEIKDFILGHLLRSDDTGVYNFFAEAVKYFREEFLTLLSTIDIYFIADTATTSHLYYRNCAVRIEADKVTPIDYIDLGGFVWKAQVIDRNFSPNEHHDCDYKTFIGNICSNDSGRIESMESTIGYMMHGYKNLSSSPAVILNDEIISDNPDGGTGKGLFMSALGNMKKLVVIDGKAFAFERSFPYQLVSADTQILCFDDVKKNFDFERLFSVVTEGLTLEKKNKDAIKIPFEKSPKISITTNYAIKGAGNSFARRKWELELHQHYNKNHTPEKEFGKLFFADWDDGDWDGFDNYMISCLGSYLSTGLVASKFVNLNIRQLSAETSHEFIEWCGLVGSTEDNKTLEVNAKLYRQDAFMEFTDEYPDFAKHGKQSISRQRFNKWLEAYCVFKHQVKPEEGRDSRGRWIRIRRKHELEYQSELNIP